MRNVPVWPLMVSMNPVVAVVSDLQVLPSVIVPAELVSRINPLCPLELVSAGVLLSVSKSTEAAPLLVTVQVQFCASFKKKVAVSSA